MSIHSLFSAGLEVGDDVSGALALQNILRYVFDEQTVHVEPEKHLGIHLPHILSERSDGDIARNIQRRESHGFVDFGRQSSERVVCKVEEGQRWEKRLKLCVGIVWKVFRKPVLHVPRYLDQVKLGEPVFVNVEFCEVLQL